MKNADDLTLRPQLDATFAPFASLSGEGGEHRAQLLLLQTME